MKRKQFNLALAGVASLLAAAVLLSKKDEEKGPPLTPLSADGVSRISIEHPGAAAIKLERRDKGWVMTAPVKAAVDAFEINGPLGLATLQTQQTIEGAPELKALELEPPQYSVRLNDHVLEFGGVEPLKFWRYIRSAGTVYLTDDPPSAALDRDYADLISKAVVPEGEEVLKIESPKLKVNKGDKDTAPLFEAWKSARALWNEQTPKPVKGESVRLTLKDRTLELVVAARDPQLKLYAPELGITYVVSKALESELLKMPEPKQAAPEPKNTPPA